MRQVFFGVSSAEIGGSILKYPVDVNGVPFGKFLSGIIPANKEEASAYYHINARFRGGIKSWKYFDSHES